MARIFLIACTRQKQTTAAPAKMLYLSRSFEKSVKLADVSNAQWWVISAKHGLLEPTKVTKPYDVNIASYSIEERKQWARNVSNSVEAKVSTSDEIVILGGAEYSSEIAALLVNKGYRVFEPLRFRSKQAQHAWLDEAIAPSNLSLDIDRFYALLQRVEGIIGGAPRLGEISTQHNLPARGVYFFFEEGELRWNGSGLRVVRIGTHAVSGGSQATLWNRLRTHRGGENQSGSHRSSIFRLHVGAALMAASRHPPLDSWGNGQTATPDVRRVEADLERSVSEYIAHLRVLWVPISDEPSAGSDRAYVEKNSIGLLTGGHGAMDVPSSTWLGLFSAQVRIQRSGLWNLNYVESGYSRGFLDILENYVEQMEGSRPATSGSLAPKNWQLLTLQKPIDGQLGLFKETHE